MVNLPHLPNYSVCRSLEKVSFFKFWKKIIPIFIDSVAEQRHYAKFLSIKLQMQHNADIKQ